MSGWTAGVRIFCPPTPYGVGRHSFGSDREHRHAVLEIPDACRHDTAFTGNSCHFANRSQRLTEVLQHEQAERRIERAVGVWEPLNGTGGELRAGVLDRFLSERYIGRDRI